MADTFGLHVLLVEDNPDDLWLLGEILRGRGHTVMACEDGESAWAAYQKTHPPLLILDWVLPGLDGLELCRLIREEEYGPDCVILVVTARDSPEDLRLVMDAGADDYVPKPLNVALFEIRLAVAEQRLRNIRERERARLALEAKSRELEAFVYALSNHLRAPLGATTDLAHALVEEHGEIIPAQARDLAQRIVASGRQSEELIKDLLAYSRMSFDQVKLRKVELQEAVSDALDRVRVDVEKRGAILAIPSTFPSVMGHHTTLVQVLVNLLSNAVKFVPDHRTPEVALRWEETEDGKAVRVWVEDNGVGIPPEEQDRIFRVFERLDGGVQRPGTGIGLAIVRRGLQRMGGEVGLSSKVGEGCRFWLEIPKSQPQE
jgi:signal transduction histidine kinase